MGVVAVCLLILLGWFAFHQEPPPPNQQSAKVEATKPVVPVLEPANDSSSEMPTNQPENSITTNAADLYRQAFALYDGLSNDQKHLLGGWHTNVDAAVEAELCEKIRPICDLMHQASAVTNCDWGVDPVTTDTLLPYLGPARNIARAAIWSAAHCRTNDVTGATDDAVAVLKLGQEVSRGAMIGCLVDMALQGLAWSYVAENLGRFQGSDAQRLAAAFNDPAYEAAPSRAMEQEADRADNAAAKLAAMPATEAEAEFSNSAQEVAKLVDGYPTNLDQASILAAYKQIADSERQLAGALASSSESDYETWLESSTDLQASNPLAKGLLESVDGFLDKVQGAEVNRALIVAGLAVAQAGANALPSYPDRSSGQPFVYTETAAGFQLQSTYQVNGKLMTMQFKLTR